MNDSKTKPTPREVPPRYKEELKLRSIKKLTLPERLRLLLGFNLEFTAVIRTEHKTGRTHQAVKVELTKDLADPPPKDRVLMVGGLK